MFTNVSIEIPRMFSLVIDARGLEIKSDEARRGLHAGSLNYNRLRRVKRYAREREHGTSLSNRDRDASCGNQPVWGGSCGHCTIDSHVLVAREAFFQFIIHYFDVIRPGASSLNSWYHSVDFSSRRIIYALDSVSIMIEGPVIMKENRRY